MMIGLVFLFVNVVRIELGQGLLPSVVVVLLHLVGVARAHSQGQRQSHQVVVDHPSLPLDRRLVAATHVAWNAVQQALHLAARHMCFESGSLGRCR